MFWIPNDLVAREKKYPKLREIDRQKNKRKPKEQKG